MAGTKAKEFKIVKYVYSETNIFGYRERRQIFLGVERGHVTASYQIQVCFCYLKQKNKILLSR